MKITATLSRYLARTYLMNMLFLFALLLGVIYLFDTVELIRRASHRPDVPIAVVLEMGFFKLPEMGEQLLPFAVLFSAIFTFSQLTRRYELIVARAAGFSVWQFLAPAVGVAMMAGILQMTVINPVGALMHAHFKQMENIYLEGKQANQIAVFSEGLWLRQEGEKTGDYVIMHAQKLTQPDWVLKNLTVFFFDDQNTFLKRLDAPQARLEPGRWVFQDAVLHSPSDNQALTEPAYILPTHLTIQDVEESFSSPTTMSFWKLPGHIRTLEETGFDASRLRVHYQNLLSQPLMLAAMVLLAATVSMRPPRMRGALLMAGVGVFIGFFVFFMSSFLQALGSSQQIPVVLAAWAPSLICLLMGLGVVMNLEDG